ncbi:hypothetical protein PIB30_027061 [Stylosanthes scabra]|uniref:Germin-like protein n=1 Tax=Stylosanthes scabra TaxID=79078 RepID=A0ABU6TCL9_9FABA|nr:hypothetical protein [Stylosanthes scabra]
MQNAEIRISADTKKCDIFLPWVAWPYDLISFFEVGTCRAFVFSLEEFPQFEYTECNVCDYDNNIFGNDNCRAESGFLVKGWQHSIIEVCLADCHNLQDTCPTSLPEKETIFINGLPCKSKDNSTAQNFKTAELTKPGPRDNFFGSSMNIVGASKFPGLNTLGISIGRIDIEVDGMVNLHSHPRATEMIYVNQGILVAAFLDTQNQLFQKSLRAGDVFMIPKGLFHFFLNRGSAAAVVFSVFNSQNPGMGSLSASTPSETTLELVENLKRKLTTSFSDLELHHATTDLASQILEIIYNH